jgi:hypothetical protein
MQGLNPTRAWNSEDYHTPGNLPTVRLIEQCSSRLPAPLLVWFFFASTAALLMLLAASRFRAD